MSLFKRNVEAVTVCVGYGDFLKETVKYNAHMFDRWVIVTDEQDEETREICRANKLKCLVTKDHKRDGEFSKGRCVERGLQHLSSDTWVLHIDADIVLPSNFRHAIEIAHLKEDTIYGADRFMVKGWNSWKALVNRGWYHDLTNNFRPHGVSIPSGYTLGARWVGPDGYVPIGFFQLWNRIGGAEEWRGVRVKSYPVGHGNACREDVQHGLQFDRRNREIIPELFVAHLESENSRIGANWCGRKTKRFAPDFGLISPQKLPPFQPLT